MDALGRKVRLPYDQLPTSISEVGAGQGRRRRAAFVAAAVILFTTFHGGSLWGPEHIDDQSVNTLTPSKHLSTFDWLSVVPRKAFEWSSCYSGQKCARLLLPMDYATPDSPPVTIAVRMIPASDPDNYHGTIFLNPGGPGGSGLSLIDGMGTDIATIVGPTFDVLSFDPRGVGSTLPAASCFDSASQRDIWGTQEGHLLVNESLALFRARSKAVAERCAQRLGGDWGIGRHASSPNVARDMLEMTQLLGQEKLQYWGFSYGAILGQYFATMYPDKIKRLVIDGVADAETYRSSDYDIDVEDTEANVNSLFKYCYQAGPEKCPIWEDSGADGIRERYFKVINDVAQNPMAIPLAEPPALLTRKTLLRHLFTATFKPVTLFPIVAQIIHAIETNNQTALASLVNQVVSPTQCNCEAGPWPGFNEAPHVIQCSDGKQLTYSEEEFAYHLSQLSAGSPTLGPMWATRWLECADWKMRPSQNFTLPFAAKETSHPILAISTRYDPVCPLKQARSVQKRFDGAALLVQESYGHCSLSVPSLCTAKYVREYFVNGTLPEPGATGATCEVDELPFVGRTEISRVLSTDDAELLEALRGVAAGMPVRDKF